MCVILQAYWSVATKRLVDNVCMTLEQDFTVRLLKDLDSACFLLGSKIGGKDFDLEVRCWPHGPFIPKRLEVVTT